MTQDSLCTLQGRDCWDAIERAARAKKKLNNDYKLCFVDTYCECEHNRTIVPESERGFCRALVRIGKSVKAENGREIWYDVTRQFKLTGAEINAAQKAKLPDLPESDVAVEPDIEPLVMS